MIHKKFTVGPSALFDGVKDFFCESLRNGYGSLSHRSELFTKISKQGIENFREFFSIPDGYKVFYTYSATEGLELAMRSLVQQKSLHISNGNFGETWAGIAEKNSFSSGLEWEKISAPFSDRVSVAEIQEKISNTVSPADMLCITANETSTGIAYSANEISKISDFIPEKTLLSVDCTSSMGAVAYDFSAADVWVFSVQKAFGLPAGLGLVLLSPKAFSRAIEGEKNNHESGNHHRFSALEAKMDKKFQTPTTPNVLGIFSFGYVCGQFLDTFATLENLEKITKQKASFLYDFFENHSCFTLAVKNPNHRSQTIIVLESSTEKITKQKKKLAENGFEVGGGYGPFKVNQLRIANFPIHRMDDMKALVKNF